MIELVFETYEFKGYSVDWMMDGTFEFNTNDGVYLGYVTPDDVIEYAEQLFKGYDMIREGTEDGAGNTLSFKGWDNDNM